MPAPTALVTVRVPPRVATRSRSPCRPEPAWGSAPADAVVADDDLEPVVLHGRGDCDVRGVGVLGHVCEGLGDGEVGGDLDGLGQPVDVGVHVGLDGAARCQALERGAEAVIAEDGGVDAPGELAQLVERLAQLGAGACEQLGGALRVALDAILGQLQCEGEPDEALLCAVVQVPLDPPPLLVGRLHDAHTRIGQLATQLVLLVDERAQLAGLAQVQHRGGRVVDVGASGHELSFPVWRRGDIGAAP